MQAVRVKDGWWLPAFLERKLMLRQTFWTLALNLTFNTPFSLFPSKMRLILLAPKANNCFVVCPQPE